MRQLILLAGLALSACSESLVDRTLDLADANVTDTELRRVQMDAQENNPTLAEDLSWVYSGRDADYFTGFRGTVREMMIKEANLVAEESNQVLPQMIESQTKFERRNEALRGASLKLSNMKLPKSRGMFESWEGTYEFENNLGLPVARLTYILSLKSGDEVIARHRGNGDNLKLDPVLPDGEKQQGKFRLSTFGFDNNSFMSRQVKDANPQDLHFQAELTDACNIENQCLMYGLRDRRREIEKRRKDLADARNIIERYKK